MASPATPRDPLPDSPPRADPSAPDPAPANGITDHERHRDVVETRRSEPPQCTKVHRTRTDAGKERALQCRQAWNSPGRSSCPARIRSPCRPAWRPGRTTFSRATTWSASSSPAPCNSPGSSSGPTAPWPPASDVAGRVDDLADEVAALGRRLFWDPRGPAFFYPQFEITLGAPARVSWSGLIDDPDDPVRLVNRLESTAMGCAWLLDRWGELRDVLESGQRWRAPDRFKAIRLLGPPAAGHGRGRPGDGDLPVVFGDGAAGGAGVQGPGQ